MILAAHVGSFSRLLIVSVAALGIATMLLIEITGIRFDELRFLFREGEERPQEYRTLGLIARYRLVRDRMRSEESGNDYTQEGKIFLALGKTLTSDADEDTKLLELISLRVLNAMNAGLGLQPIKRYKSNYAAKLGEQAYILELNRDYEHAATKFSAVMQATGEQKPEYFFSLLHRGFCFALGGKRREALSDFERVITSGAPKEIKLTATVLKALLGEFEGELTGIANLPDSEIKAEKLFQNALYRPAINIFTKNGHDHLSNRARFYLGRSYEEIGETPKAIPEYRQIVATQGDALYKRLANRRLFVLGLVHDGGGKLIEEAKKTGIEIDDIDFIRELGSFSPIADQIRGRKTAIARKSGIVLGNLTEAPRTAISAPLSPPKEAIVETLKTPPKPAPVIKFERITTNDGNIIVGRIVSERADSVTIETVAGKIKIVKDNIAGRQRIQK